MSEGSAMPTARAVAASPSSPAVSPVPASIPIADATELNDRRLQSLAQLMSGISEDCWCAGWINGNEFALYRMAFEGAPRRYGMSEVRLDDVEELRRLARLTGQWWQWGSDGEEPVPLEAFAQAIEARRAATLGAVHESAVRQEAPTPSPEACTQTPPAKHQEQGS